MELIDPHVEVKEYASWAEARRFLEQLASHYLFRGHGDADWALASSLERATRSRPSREIEDLLRAQFQSAAHLYQSVLPKDDDLVSWLALMQHHGVPTRLLDFTRSPHVAAFFAAQHSGTSKYCVWAFDFIELRRAAIKEIGKRAGDDYADPPFGQSEAFQDLLRMKDIPFAVPVRPSFFNARQTNQRGLFLCPGSLRSSFIRNLVALEEHMSPAWGYKVILPDSTRIDALKDLYSLNVHPGTLFPGLDGFADSLSLRLRLLEELGHLEWKLHERPLLTDLGLW